MIEYNRHDMLEISFEGRCRIFYELLKEDKSISRDVLSELLLSNKIIIPGIVRRGIKDESKNVNVGFVSHRRNENGKIKVASYVSQNEISRFISPYIIPFLPYEANKKCLFAAKKLLDLPETLNGNIGITGSVAMEILTGLPYTHDTSDLDVIVKNLSRSKVLSVFTVLMQIGQEIGTAIDIEIQLQNGYGIKAKELFVGSCTLLGKGLYDVKLLERSEVSELLR